MRVGISLLTLVPGEVGGAETSARGLTRGLAEAGTLDYTALVPPAAPGAGEGLPEVLVSEYRRGGSFPCRALSSGPPPPAREPALPRRGGGAPGGAPPPSSLPPPCVRAARPLY